MEEMVKSGSEYSVDIVRLIFLTVATLQEETGGIDMFQWMKDLGEGQSSVDINMHMYNNHMSMTTTNFTFNVGAESVAGTKLPRAGKVERRRAQDSDVSIRDE